MVWKKWWPFEGEKDADTQTSQQPSQTQSKTFYRSYSSSRTCKPDTEDPAFIICKEKVQDGNNSYQNEQRVPINDSTPTAFANDTLRELSEMSSHFEKEFNAFPFFAPIFSPFFKDFPEFSFHNPEAFPQNHYQHNQGQKQQQKQNTTPRQQPNSRYYFTANGERDFSIKDL